MSRLSSHFRTIYWRQFLLTAIMCFLSLSLLGVSFLSFGYNLLLKQSRQELTYSAEQLAVIVSGMSENRRFPESENFDAFVKFAGSSSDIDLLLYNASTGMVLTFSPDSPERATSPFSVPKELDGVLTRGTEFTGILSLSPWQSDRVYAAAVPIRSSDQVSIVGMVLAVTRGTTFHRFWQDYLSTFAGVAVIVLLVTIFAVSIMANSFTKPIQEMAQATRRLADGDYDVRVNDYNRNDEIGALASSFNSMANSLQETERQRREFIANISHELKTPMTTIAGYTDGILDGTIPKEKETKYLQIISAESRRLSQLVRRMLDISRLQSKDYSPVFSSFDIGECMRQVLISLEGKIVDRSLDVDVLIPDTPVLVNGDQAQITQVVYNLLENASKYATPGSTIGFYLMTGNGQALISIQNEGKDIPAEEIPLLFERFHKIDPSRSEDKDGVGLGLAIVKTILDQHHEKITVTSQDGKTEFSFHLPLAE